MPQPPRQEQQPISAMDFLRGTPGQFRAHKQLPVEPEPVRTGRIPKRTRKLVWAIFGLWTLTIVGAVAYLQLTVYAGQIQRAANSAQLTPAASSGAGDATQPAQEPPSALNAIDDTAATEPPAQASPPLAGPAPGTSRPLHPRYSPLRCPRSPRPPKCWRLRRRFCRPQQRLSRRRRPWPPRPLIVRRCTRPFHRNRPHRQHLSRPPRSWIADCSCHAGTQCWDSATYPQHACSTSERLLSAAPERRPSLGTHTMLPSWHRSRRRVSSPTRPPRSPGHRKAAALGDTDAVRQLKRFAPAQ